MKQTQFFKNSEKAYGGSLLKKRKGRVGPRPLAAKQTMHLVLRSSQAIGRLSFIKHRKLIARIIKRFAQKFGCG